MDAGVPDVFIAVIKRVDVAVQGAPGAGIKFLDVPVIYIRIREPVVKAEEGLAVAVLVVVVEGQVPVQEEEQYYQTLI